MTPAQIELVQTSYRMVQPEAPELARLLYTRWLATDPSLEQMFPGNLEQQVRNLTQMIGAAARALRRLERILPAVEDLGRRHARYGVRDEHYVQAGAALLWTLHKVLGESFTPAVCEAWIAMYEVVAAAMKRGWLAAKAA